mmetsp:Transcript_8361/g.24822  ORF Transcript_8361/g.24822 Transcript_8361/m.24822 type:complete len:223 (+) Transcript_8361:392-1060(+)
MDHSVSCASAGWRKQPILTHSGSSRSEWRHNHSIFNLSCPPNVKRMTPTGVNGRFSGARNGSGDTRSDSGRRTLARPAYAASPNTLCHAFCELAFKSCCSSSAIGPPSAAALASRCTSRSRTRAARSESTTSPGHTKRTDVFLTPRVCDIPEASYTAASRKPPWFGNTSPTKVPSTCIKSLSGLMRSSAGRDDSRVPHASMSWKKRNTAERRSASASGMPKP